MSTDCRPATRRGSFVCAFVHRQASTRWSLPVLLLALTALPLLTGCSDSTGPEAPAVYARGEIISIDKGLGYTRTQTLEFPAQVGAAFADSQRFGLDTWSITYMSADTAGNPQIVSGALIVPRTDEARPLLSIQHGTQTRRTLVASTPPAPMLSQEGQIGIIMASFGYLIVVPDYPGFGVSEIPHPYLHADSLTPCIIDGLRAARNWAGDNEFTLDDRIFLTGYSEGGYVTLAAQKEIEAEHSSEFALTAVAPMAGLYDLHATMLSIFSAADYSTPAYLAWVMTAFDALYGWDRLDEFILAPWAGQLPDLFGGDYTFGEIVNSLPATFTNLMNPTFVADVLAGDEPAFVAALIENSLLDFTPIAPLHFIHGTADDIVPYQNALDAVDVFTTRGATDIELTPIPGGDHNTAGLPAVLTMIEWFAQIRDEYNLEYNQQR